MTAAATRARKPPSRKDPRYVDFIEEQLLLAKSRIDELMALGPMPSRTREALDNLLWIVHKLAEAGDPFGKGRALEEGGMSSPRGRYDQPTPHRTAEESTAYRALLRLTGDIEHSTRVAEWVYDGPPPRNGDTKRRRRPECPSTPPCRNARGGTRRQGNGDVFCGGCGTPYPDTT